MTAIQHRKGDILIPSKEGWGSNKGEVPKFVVVLNIYDNDEYRVVTDDERFLVVYDYEIERDPKRRYEP